MQGEMNILKIILDSGLVVKCVLILLILSSIFSWAIILMKKNYMNQMFKLNQEFLDIFRQSPTLRDVAVNTENLTTSPYKRVFDEGYNEFSRLIEEAGDHKLKEHFQNFGLGSIERAMKKGANSSNIDLEDRLSTLASIGSVTPFVGLFGTVWGIINSFTGLAGGGATLDAVAPGIAEALVATAVGLAAAIPAVWFYNSFNTRVETLNTGIDSFEQELLNSVERSIL